MSRPSPEGVTWDTATNGRPLPLRPGSHGDAAAKERPFSTLSAEYRLHFHTAFGALGSSGAAQPGELLGVRAGRVNHPTPVRRSRSGPGAVPTDTMRTEKLL